MQIYFFRKSAHHARKSRGSDGRLPGTLPGAGVVQSEASEPRPRQRQGEHLKAYIDDCMAGDEGPHGENFNMRWIASLVAEACRILARGGIFLYPRDARPGYRHGRLRLVYEANPVAFVVEQAGGGATDGECRILDIVPTALHQRVPLVFGSRDKVDRVARYHGDTHAIGERSPLFRRRGLFRN